MITDSAESNARKAKGETLQKAIEAGLKAAFPEYADNIESSPMSAHGEDIRIKSNAARKAVPVSIEAKWKTTGLSPVYAAYEQAARQAEVLPSTLAITPVAAIQQEGCDPLIVMSMEDWLVFTKRLHRLTANNSGSTFNGTEAPPWQNKSNNSCAST